MNVAYLYYWATSANDPVQMMKYALHYAKNECECQFDVFNALDLMDNQ
jgi:hypothetical protein